MPTNPESEKPPGANERRLKIERFSQYARDNHKRPGFPSQCHSDDRLAPPLQAALQYAARGWRVFPVRVNKTPLVAHGLRDATTDPDRIRDWWCRYSDALVAIATGAASGVVTLDIDMHGALNGFDTLAELGIYALPPTPIAHTPSGGIHVYLQWPGHFVKSRANALGPGLDILGDGGSAILPPGPDRFWDPHLGLDTPLAQFPSWMEEQVPREQRPIVPRFLRRGRRTRYGRASLDDAVHRICQAPAGQQEVTLNSEVFKIARLVRVGLLASGPAISALSWAAHQMPNYDPRRPWRASEIDRKVRRTFAQGLAKPLGRGRQ